MAKSTYNIVDTKTNKAVMTVEVVRNVGIILASLNKKNPNRYILVVTKK